MRKILYIISVVFTVAIFTSCTEDDGAVYPTPTEFSASPSAADYETTGGVVEVIINGGNLGWSIEASDTWIQLSKVYGSGDATIEISVEANTSEGSRTGTVVISPTFEREPITIEIKQK